MERHDKITDTPTVAALPLPSACPEDTMDRVSKDHDYTTSVTPGFILTDVITSTVFSDASGGINTYASLYIKHEVGVDSQFYYAEIHENEPSPSSTFNDPWNSIYSLLKNARIIIDQCGKGGRDHGNGVTRGMTEVTAAYNCALTADFFGDAPYNRTALVDEKGSPVYMTPKVGMQQEIYIQIISYLDDAITNLRKKDLADMTEQGFLYAGDVDKWLKFACGLKARYTMRLINHSSNKSADHEEVLDYVSKPLTSADDQAAFDIYDSNNISLFYGFYNSRVGFEASTSLGIKLLAYSDSRADCVSFTPIVDKERSQVTANDLSLALVPDGSPDQSTSKYGISALVYAKTAPALLMSYHELMFLKAETLYRLSRDTEDALRGAVVADSLNAENSINIVIRELESGLNINPSEVITETPTRKYFDDVVKAKYAANLL